MRDRAIVLNRDLLFGSRIRSVLAAQGLTATFVGTTDAFIAEMREQGDASAIGIVDMNGEVAWETLGDELGSIPEAPPIVAFGPHVDVENRRAAKRAGLTRIVSNGQFHQEMATLIERYRRS
jgi:FixJ family two-component response regulator